MGTLEHHLVFYCAPTLAKLKTAGLFSFPYTSPAGLYSMVETCSDFLSAKGIRIEVLRLQKDRALLYCYRPFLLCADLQRPCVVEFLLRYGYDASDMDSALLRLRERLEECLEFPHEIGLFLGYPLCDVEGFIENKGENFKCCCDWKVYGDEQACQEMFRMYRKCRECYMRFWREGSSVLQLAVNS